MYTCQVLLLIWASNRHFKIIWTDCLRLFVVVCTVFYVLLIKYRMCLPACFVTSADKRQLWVYLCYLLPEAICCCLETFNVYVVLLMLFCIVVNKLSWPLLLTLGTYRYI